MNIQCPGCSTVHQVPEEIRGKTVRCNNCGATFAANEMPPAAAPAGRWAGTPPSPATPPSAPTPPAQAVTGPAPGAAGTAPATASPAQPAAAAAAPGARRTWFATLKLKLRAANLRRQTRGLHRAVEDQWEKLGMMVLNQRPGGLDVNPELTELSQIQATLADRQNTLQTLKGTQGSKAVVREIQQEMAQLQNRQRDVVLGVGRKADSARIDTPNAALHYSAIDRLRQTQANNENELAQLQAELGTEASSLSLGRLLKPALIGAGAIVALVVVVILLMKVLSGGGWKAYADYMPDDLVALAVVDFGSIRKSPLEDELMGKIPWPESDDINLSKDDIAKIVMIGSEDDGNVALVFTRKNRDLKDIFEDLDDEEEYHGYTYAAANAKFDGGRPETFYVAKTASGVFCQADRESALKAALKRLDEGKHPELNEEVLSALEAVDSYDVYHVQQGGAPFWGTEDTKAVAYGFSVGSSYEFTGVNVFRRESRAEDTVKEFTDALKELDDKPDSDKIDEKDWNRVLAMLRGIDVTRDGKTVRYRASWSADDAKLLFKVSDNPGEWGAVGNFVFQADILPKRTL